MKKFIIIAIFLILCPSVYAQYDDEVEVIITLTEAVNIMIKICEYELSFERNKEEEAEYLLYLAGFTSKYNLSMEIRSNIASMSHSERVYYIGVLYWFLDSSGMYLGSTAWTQSTPTSLDFNNNAEVIITLTEKINDVISLYDEVFKKNILLGIHELDIETVKEEDYPFYSTVYRAYELALEMKLLVAILNHNERIYCLGMLSAIFDSLRIQI